MHRSKSANMYSYVNYVSLVREKYGTGIGKETLLIATIIRSSPLVVPPVLVLEREDITSLAFQMSYSGGGGDGSGGWGGYQGYGGGYGGAAGYGGGYGGAPGAGGYGAPAPPGSYSQPPLPSGPPPGAARGGGMGGGKDLGSSLMALSQQSSGSGGGSYMGRGGGLGSGTVAGGRGGRGGPGGLSSYSAYQTNNKRKFDGGGRGGGGGGRGGFHDGDEKKPRKDNKPREGREPPLNIYIDPKFNYWNLPVKARVLLISNVPQVSFSTAKSGREEYYNNLLLVQAICMPDLLFNLFSFYGDVERIKILRRKTTCALVEFSTATFAAIAR